MHTHDDQGEKIRLPRPRDLWTAVGLLTAWAVDGSDVRSAAAAPAMLFFPVVGGLMGLLLTGANWLVRERLPAAASALVLVALWEGISGGAALRVGAGIAAKTRQGEAAGGSSGYILMAAVLLLKVVLLATYAGSRPAALLFAPMLARWAMVVLAVGARDALAPSSKLNAAITFREFALTSIFTCVVVFTLAEAFGILLVVGVAALTLALRLVQHRRPGGASWPLLLGSAELVELLVLGMAAAVAGARP